MPASTDSKEPRIIFENNEFIAVEKPAGLLVHAVRVSALKVKKGLINEERRKEATLAGWMVGRYPEIANVGDDPEFRPGIVHRLDKETSGVIIVARTQEAFEWLKKTFQAHGMKKEYKALVYGIPDLKKGIINKPIGIKTGSLKRSIHSTKMAKEAVTEYAIEKTYTTADGEKKEFALLAVYPQTGRTHQIRVHLASIGHPIVGDRLYGGRYIRMMGDARLMLHAAEISFTDPHGNRFSFGAPLPSDFLSVIHSVAKVLKETI